MVSTAVYFVSPYNGWQATRARTLPSGKLLPGKAQWLLSQQECSSPAYLTVQLRRESGVLYTNNWGVEPAPARTVTVTEQRKPVSKSTANTVTTTVIASVKAETTSIR